MLRLTWKSARQWQRTRVQPQAQYSCNSPQPYGGCGYRAPPPPCSCTPPPIPCCGNRIVPPGDCRQSYVSPNPCCPIAPEDEHTYLKYKYIFFFVMVPIIIFQYLRAMAHPTPCKPICREYEYMRRRTKKYPWSDGNKTFFHNDHTNALPPCTTPPPVCEE